MPLYDYKALNQTGRRVTGQLTANNESDLYQRLKQINLELLSAAPEKKKKGINLFDSKISNRELVQMCLHLQQLSAAGVSLMDGLADVRDSTDHRRLRDLMAEIFEDVAAGRSLSEAFAQHPKYFGNVFQSLLRAGEESGNLTEAFSQLIKHVKWIDAVNGKIKKATRYPMVMLFVMVVLFVVMMTVVVPQVVSFLVSMGQKLPFMTVALINTSNFVKDFWYIMFGVPILLAFAARTMIKMSPTFAYQYDFFILRAPLFGEITRKISLARFAHFFATMFQSGVPILTCLDTARKVVGNLCLERSLGTVRSGVEDGEALSIGLRNTGEFPNLVVRLVKIGEESGNLGETLNNVTDFYDRDVDEAVDGLVGMIEPILTAFAGLMMAWIVLAVVGPIYSSISNLG